MALRHFFIFEAAADGSPTGQLHRLLMADDSFQPLSNWPDAERFEPECAAAWDRDVASKGGHENTVPELAQLGRLLMAFTHDGHMVEVFSDGRWVPLMVDVMGMSQILTVGSSSQKLYIHRSGAGRVRQIDMVGVEPEDVPNAERPQRPNGKVSAVMYSNRIIPGTLEACIRAVA